MLMSPPLIVGETGAAEGGGGGGGGLNPATARQAPCSFNPREREPNTSMGFGKGPGWPPRGGRYYLSHIASYSLFSLMMGRYAWGGLVDSDSASSSRFQQEKWSLGSLQWFCGVLGR